MRNKWKQSITKGLCVVLASTMIVECSGMHSLQAMQTVQAEESQVAEAAWDGVTREKVWELDRCKVVYSLTDIWADGYTASVTVENTSDTAIDNWHVAFPVQEEIVDIWNVQMIDTEDTMVFKNLGWNQDIAAGQSVSFGFTANGAFSNFPAICELPASRQYVEETDYEITYQVTNAWDDGHNGEICIRNVSDKTIEDWFVSFDCAHEISDLWSGKIVSNENGRYLIQNMDYNQNIAAGAEVRIGFTVQCPAEEIPTGYRLEQIALGGGNSEQGTTDGGDVSGSDISSGDISGGDVSGSDVEEMVLKIDTEQFDYNEVADYYLTQDCIEKLTGTLTCEEKVKQILFTVTDINGMVVDKGECSAQANWTINDIGFVIGYNDISVTAVCKSGEELTAAISMMNFNQENVDATDIDRDDTDGDGIDNYTETIFGTDPMSDDTDGDKIKDLDEMGKTGTNPTLEDTDEDGILDGQEDPDEDGLINLEEIKAGTEPLYEDYDNDKLNDGDEVLKYHTDPLVEDTDEDGLRDGEDVIMGYEPLNPDTDGDDILDGDEIVYQTAVEEIDQERVAGITEVAVSMDCAGYIDNEVSIFNVYNLDMRTTDVVGRVGAAVDIETTQEFEEATITFTYDEAALGDSLEDNLRIVWYDEENDEYVVMDEETVIDKENNTLSCKTTHFSTWLVVDIMKWLDAMGVDLDYGNVVYKQEFVYDVAYLYFDDKLYNKKEGKVTNIAYGQNKAVYSNHEWGAWMINGNYENKEYTYEAAFEHLLNQLGSMKHNIIRKQLYVICAEDVDYDARLVRKANSLGISINFITKFHKDGERPNMTKMAKSTSGKCIKTANWCKAEVDREKYVDSYEVCVKLLDNRYLDDDWDGLLNVFEEKGMLLSNGTVVRTESWYSDTDKDGVSDFVEMGGLPEEVKYTIGGKEYTFYIFKGALYEELTDEFIFVDGTPNKDGTVITEKLDYVPYSYASNKFAWYGNPDDPQKEYVFMNDKQYYRGRDELYNLFSHKLDEVTPEMHAFYETTNVSALYFLVQYRLAMAYECLVAYVNATGGDSLGIDGMGTRKYVDIDSILSNKRNNSAYDNFKQNLYSATKVAKSVLNQHNTEIYFAVAPTTNWDGCAYLDKFKKDDILTSLANFEAAATFNMSIAVATFHCIYDPETKEYTMEYKYYLADYYDFENADVFEEQNLLGKCRSYELYGKTQGDFKWSDSQDALEVISDIEFGE